MCWTGFVTILLHIDRCFIFKFLLKFPIVSCLLVNTISSCNLHVLPRILFASSDSWKITGMRVKQKNMENEVWQYFIRIEFKPIQSLDFSRKNHVNKFSHFRNINLTVLLWTIFHWFADQLVDGWEMMKKYGLLKAKVLLLRTRNHFVWKKKN